MKKDKSNFKRGGKMNPQQKAIRLINDYLKDFSEIYNLSKG